MPRTSDLTALCEKTAHVIRGGLQRSPAHAPEMAKFAGQILHAAREAADEMRRAERRVRQSKVIAVNVRAGRTILPLAEHADLMAEYDAA